MASHVSNPSGTPPLRHLSIGEEALLDRRADFFGQPPMVPQSHSCLGGDLSAPLFGFSG